MALTITSHGIFTVSGADLAAAVAAITTISGADMNFIPVANGQRVFVYSLAET